MKRILPLASLTLILTLGALATADHHEKGHKDAHNDQTHSGQAHSSQADWFNVHKCDICQPIAKHEAMMMSMKWECHKLDNGMLMVTVLPESQVSEFKKAAKEMNGFIAKLEKGLVKPKALCGFCSAFGDLKMAGAKVQKLDTQFGDITIVTATDQAIIKQIHAHADRTVEETKKMLAQAG